MYTEHDDYLYAVARRIARPNDVEDYVQEGKVIIWQQIQQGKEDWGWLRRCARNRMLVLHHHESAQKRGGTGELKTISDQRRAVYSGTLPHDAVRDLSPGTEDPLPLIDVRRVVASLDARQREYVFRRFWLDYSYAQLNAHFGLTNTNTVIWRRARAKLLANLV